MLFSILVATGRAAGHAALEADLACRRDADHRIQGFVQTALISGGVERKVSLMAYTMPFWVVLFAWALQGERPTARHWAASRWPPSGLVCFLEPWAGLGDLAPVALGLMQRLVLGPGTVLSKRMFERHAPDIMTFTAWQMLLGGVVILPFAWLVPQIPAQWDGWRLWLGIELHRAGRHGAGLDPVAAGGAPGAGLDRRTVQPGRAGGGCAVGLGDPGRTAHPDRDGRHGPDPVGPVGSQPGRAAASRAAS